MYMVLTISYIHHRHLSLSESEHLRTFVSHHTSQCVELLSNEIAHPIPQDQRDAVWIGATFLGIVVFASLSVTIAEEVWPLKSDSSDLEWVRMTRNKMSLWTLLEPLRENGLFRGMAGEYEEMFEPVATDAKAAHRPHMPFGCILDSRKQSVLYRCPHTSSAMGPIV